MPRQAGLPIHCKAVYAATLNVVVWKRFQAAKAAPEKDPSKSPPPNRKDIEIMRLQSELDDAHKKLRAFEHDKISEGRDWDWQDTPQEIAEAMLRLYPDKAKRLGAALRKLEQIHHQEATAKNRRSLIVTNPMLNRPMFLTCINAAKNRHRFYTVQLTRTLFGEWCLLREWGRIGSPGTVRLESYGTEDEAREAQRRTTHTRIRHGYSQVQP